jgi:hypothetical protein
MDARVITARRRQHVVISDRIGDFLGVWVPWRHQTVDVRSRDTAVNLIWCTGVTGRLRPVVIFQFDIEDSADLFVWILSERC